MILILCSWLSSLKSPDRPVESSDDHPGAGLISLGYFHQPPDREYLHYLEIAFLEVHLPRLSVVLGIIVLDVDVHDVQDLFRAVVADGFGQYVYWILTARDLAHLDLAVHKHFLLYPTLLAQGFA